MKEVRLTMVLVMAILFTLLPIASWAATATATASVSATIPSVTTATLGRDTNSVTRGSATQIVFDRLDSADPGVSEPNAGFMYAPYRSETDNLGGTGKNWHVVNIAANGSTLVLSVSVTGSVGTVPLTNILRLWSGGFFAPGSSTPITGTPSTVWEFANGWQRSLNQPFTGTVPFSYQLSVTDIPAGAYSGTITLTLTTT